MVKVYHTTRIKIFIFLLTSLLWSQPGLTEFNGEFFVFPQANALFRSGIDKPLPGRERHHEMLEGDHYEAAVDLFLTYEVGNFRFLGEYLLSTEEQDVERLQLGWIFGSHLFWLGRFHNPVGDWNTRYHHGAYIQTSISRPAIVAYEEHGGILPMHQAGLLAEGMFITAGGNLGYSFSLANGPEFDGDLRPWDVLDPSAGQHDTSVTLNLFRQQENSRIGLFGNYNRIPSTQQDLNEIKQWILGGYIDHEFERGNVYTAMYYVANQFIGPAGIIDDSFLNAFLQAEYQVSQKFRIFGRVEGTTGSQGDQYLALFPNFVKERLLGGLRFDFVRRNALTLEVSSNQIQADHYNQLMLQWSAQF